MLEHLKDGTSMVLGLPVPYKVAYDTRGRNDFNSSTIKTELESLETRTETCLPSGVLRPYTQSLEPVSNITHEPIASDKPTDTYTGKLNLLTLAQYKKHINHIPDVKDDWWLLTPIEHVSSIYSYLSPKPAEAMYVNAVTGIAESTPTTEKKSIRPMMVLDSSITVSLANES